MNPIVVVTGNDHKYAEMRAIVGPDLERVSLDIPEIQSLDLREVIKAKAEAAYNFVQKTVVVEDVSIEISALGGLPGPLVKWFIQTLGPAGIARLVLKEQDNRAVVRTALDLYNGSRHQLFTAEVEGSVAAEPRGENGFGFDSIFVPTGQRLTYAEMPDEQKNTISHRAIALGKLKDHLTNS